MPTLIGNLYNIEGERPKKVATFRLVRGKVKVRVWRDFPEVEVVRAAADRANEYLQKLVERGAKPEDCLQVLEESIGVDLIFRAELQGRFFWSGTILEPDLKFEEVDDHE